MGCWEGQKGVWLESTHRALSWKNCLCLLEANWWGESMFHVTAVWEVEGTAPGGGRVPVRSVPSSSLSSACGTQCLPFRLPGVCVHQSPLVFSAVALSALLPLAFFASIGFSLKLHSRNQNSYFYPLQTCLLHKLEKYQMNWARYFFFLPSVALVWHHCWGHSLVLWPSRQWMMTIVRYWEPVSEHRSWESSRFGSSLFCFTFHWE